MEKDKDLVVLNAQADDMQPEDDQFTVRFSKPYAFEGKTYTEVDLSGMEDLSAEDMIAAEKYLTRNGGVSATPELSIAYVCFIAANASGLPIEFYRRLSPKDVIKVKNRVTSFFYAED